MKEFLRQVAEHYCSEAEAPQRCFIFPNRRSLVFFKEYFRQSVASGIGAGRPMLAPRMFTINDFFYELSGQKATDKVHLLLELYASYSKLNPSAEPLDDFIFWGDVLLGDFDDTDKYLVDPVQLFQNVSDLKNIQDSYEYLTDEQREAIEHFVGHFREGAPVKEVKQKFLQIWNILLPLYKDFKERLAQKGMSYEGMAYRQTVELLNDTPVVDVLSQRFGEDTRFVFVGLNAICECEKKLLKKMHDAGVAEFCWDYSSDLIKNSKNKSSFFLHENIEMFPQAFKLDANGLEVPEVNVLSVPSSVGQAKQVPGILAKVAADGDLGKVGIDTALVLPDESLLLPVLNTLPHEVKNINVTMGYPMGESAWWSLMNEISTLQMHLREKGGEWFFYHKQVWSILSSSILKSVLSAKVMASMMELKKKASYYVSQKDLAIDPILEAIFKPVAKDIRSKSSAQIAQIESYQKDVVLALAPHMKDDTDMSIELEFAKSFYLAVGKLQNIDLEVLPATYFRLLAQLLAGMSVPFTGEPLHGLQIMGPLEMRALDFENVVILSCNEGMFPRRSVSSSFIPSELRQCFGLPTYEFQDAVWAYYFYRVIQRAKKVWLVFDSRTDGLKGGEESRYIKQLELHFNLHLNRFVAKAAIGDAVEESDIPKTPEDVDVVKNTSLSASALQNYLQCPAKFYYHTVKKLKPDDEVAESLDAGMIGNVYHGTMQALYFGPVAMDPAFSMDRENVEAHLSEQQKSVSIDYIKGWLGRKDAIKARIRSLVQAELHNSFEVTGRNLVYEDVVLQYVCKTLERDVELMKEKKVSEFEILGLELNCKWQYEGYRFVGYIDRLDSVVPGVVRVVDYKTGKVEDADVDIDDANAQNVVDSLFAPDVKNRPKIAMQLFLYDMFIEDSDMVKGKEIVNSIYPAAKLFVSPVMEVARSARFTELMKEKLKGMLEEISDLSVGFRRTSDTKTCEYCDFKTICGR